MNRKRDQLLEEPLLSAGEIESWVTDVRATQAGTIPSNVGSDFWERAKLKWFGAKAMRKSVPQMRLSIGR